MDPVRHFQLQLAVLNRLIFCVGVLQWQSYCYKNPVLFLVVGAVLGLGGYSGAKLFFCVVERHFFNFQPSDSAVAGTKETREKR
jgi:hypothetical protein